MTDKGTTIFGSEYATVEYSKDNATFTQIPGANGWEESGGEAPEYDAVSFSGVGSRTGFARPPTISIQANYIPNHAAWVALLDANEAREALYFRVTTKEESIYPGTGDDKVSIAITTGAVTFATGHGPDLTLEDFDVGLVIKVGAGAKKYTIDTISAAGVAVVKPAPEAAVTPQNYVIILPSLRMGPVRADIRNLGRVSLGSEAAMTTTIELKARARLPKPTIV